MLTSFWTYLIWLLLATLLGIGVNLVYAYFVSRTRSSLSISLKHGGNRLETIGFDRVELEKLIEQVISIQRQPQTFIAYSAPDRDFAIKLADDLQANGIRAWLDIREIQIGDSIVDEIRKGIEDSQWIILIIGHESNWIQLELNFALNQEKQRERTIILPVLYKDISTEKLPTEIQNRLYIDFRDNYTKSLQTLIRRIYFDSSALSRLISALHDNSPNVRKSAATAIGTLGDSQSLDPLTNALGDTSTEVQEAAAKALGKLGDSRAIEPLLHVLGDESSEVRRAAIEALGELGDSRAIEPLLHTVRDVSTEIHTAAVEALAKLGSAPTNRLLVDALKDESSQIAKMTEQVNQVKSELSLKELIFEHPTSVQAIIITISNYPPPFSDISLDTYRMQEVIRVLEEAGVRYEILSDGQATQNNILRSVYELVDRAKEADTLVIYFAGHGTVNPVSKEVYLLPSDVNLAGLADTAISSQRLVSIFEMSRSRRNIIILDSVYNGVISSGQEDLESALQRQFDDDKLVVVMSPKQLENELEIIR